MIPVANLPNSMGQSGPVPAGSRCTANRGSSPTRIRPPAPTPSSTRRQRAERAQFTGVPAGGVVLGIVDLGVAEALQHLTQAQQAVAATAPDTLEIDDDGDDLLADPGLVNDIAFGSDDRRTTITEISGIVDIDEIALIDAGIGTGDGQLEVAIYGIGERGVQHHLGACPGQRASGLRKPHVVADRDTETADVGHVEDRVIASPGDPLLIGNEGIELAVAGHHLTRTIDHRCGVVEGVAIELVERAGQQSVL